MSSTREVSFTPNPNMRAALTRQAEIHQDPKAAVVKRALRGYLSQQGWSVDFLDGYDVAPMKDGSSPFPDGWNERDGGKR